MHTKFASTFLFLLTFFAVFNAQAASGMPDEFFVGNSPSQMFVQHWPGERAPTEKKRTAIMIHGGLHTGTGFISTPDAREGFAPMFARAGWDVYVVDWPGVGRSGFSYPKDLNTGVNDIISAVGALLQRTGPAVLIGHSIGGAISFKVAENYPEKVLSVVAMAPASMEVRSTSVAAAALDKQVSISREEAANRFGNSGKFPKLAFESYFNSLVPYSPRIRNSAVGTNDELRLDRSRLSVWKEVPVLFLIAEEDRTVPLALSTPTAELIGVSQISLGKDWSLPGHGHLFPIEYGNDEIAVKIRAWLAGNTSDKTK